MTSCAVILRNYSHVLFLNLNIIFIFSILAFCKIVLYYSNTNDPYISSISLIEEVIQESSGRMKFLYLCGGLHLIVNVQLLLVLLNLLWLNDLMMNECDMYVSDVCKIF